MAKKIIGALIVFILLCATVTAGADMYAQHGVVLYKHQNETTILTRDGNIWSINNAWYHAGDNVIFRDLETEAVEDDEIMRCLNETNENKNCHRNITVRILGAQIWIPAVDASSRNRYPISEIQRMAVALWQRWNLYMLGEKIPSAKQLRIR